MRQHFVNGLRTGVAFAAVGFFLSFGDLLFRGTEAWLNQLLFIPIAFAIGVLGGTVFSLLMRRRRADHSGDRARAGAIAAMVALVFIPLGYLRREPGPGEFSHLGLAIVVLLFGAAVGAGLGTLYGEKLRLSDRDRAT